MARLTVIVCVYNMVREAPRTILSASAPYQRDLAVDDYEVLIVDNGSTRRLPDAYIASLPSNVRIVDVPAPKPSPVFALNWAANHVATGDLLLFAIDGARIFTDRLFASACEAHAAFDDPFVYTIGLHLGPDVQMLSTQVGYDETVEDALIASSGWPDDPDALWSVAVLAGSSQNGFSGRIAESNAFCVSRSLFERMGGYDERFASPGGGYANLELFERYAMRQSAVNVCLLSEGTFHQTHGGIATSSRVPQREMRSEYRAIAGRDYSIPRYEAEQFGSVRPAAQHFLKRASE